MPRGIEYRTAGFVDIVQGCGAVLYRKRFFLAPGPESTTPRRLFLSGSWAETFSVVSITTAALLSPVRPVCACGTCETSECARQPRHPIAAATALVAGTSTTHPSTTALRNRARACCLHCCAHTAVGCMSAFWRRSFDGRRRWPPCRMLRGHRCCVLWQTPLVHSRTPPPAVGPLHAARVRRQLHHLV